MPKQSTHYDIKYYKKFEKHGRIKQWLLSYIDRQGAVLPMLRKYYATDSELVDFACGKGFFLKYATKYFQCTGIDFSKAAISQAKKNAPNAKLITGSLNVLKDKYTDNSVDILTCFAMLEHTDKHTEYLKEFWRILKPSGMAVVAVPITDSIALWSRKQQWTVLEDSSHVRIYSRNGWTNLFNNHGLLVSKIWSNGIMNSPTPYYRLSPSMMPVHYLSQFLGILGIKLPAYFSDLDFFVLIKNPHHSN